MPQSKAEINLRAAAVLAAEIRDYLSKQVVTNDRRRELSYLTEAASSLERLVAQGWGKALHNEINGDVSGFVAQSGDRGPVTL